jgi:hypothetical protein
VPPASVAAIRAAVLQLNDDKAFAEDAMKTVGFVPEYTAGPETNRQVRSSLTVKPEVRRFVLDYIKSANK